MDISIILAAGEGTRMNSKYPKVLKKLMGRSLLEHVIDAAMKANISKNYVIVGHGADLIKESLSGTDIVYRNQPVEEGSPYGTGYAVMQAMDDIRDSDRVVILCADAPLIQSSTISGMFEMMNNESLDAVVLSSIVSNPFNYGRIVKKSSGEVIKIVEENDADDATKKINEINSGVYTFKGKMLKNALKQLNNDNAKNEYYLTDVIEILAKEGKKVGSFLSENFEETLGVNSNYQLSYLTNILRRKIIEKHLSEGVQIIDPSNTYIEVNVQIGRDTVIYPGVTVEKGSTIGEDVVLRGNTRIVNSEIGDGSEIDSSLIEESFVGQGVKIGPFAHLRPHSVLKNNSKVGNFVEVKNSNIGEGTKINHLSYVGDADVGKNVNFGCGSIVVNYDGVKKYRSSIGDSAFIGCNSNIVSPVRIDGNTFVAAGSTITKEVSEYQLAVERAEQKNIDGWVKKHMNK